MALAKYADDLNKDEAKPKFSYKCQAIRFDDYQRTSFIDEDSNFLFENSFRHYNNYLLL